MVKTIDPAPGRYDANDGFGSLKGRRYPHTGIDFGVSSGTDFPAFASGDVVFSGWEPTGGNGYCLAWKLDGTDKFAAYLHGLRTPPVSVGDHIDVGQRGVFFSGNSGTNSQGPHVHLTLSGSPRAYQGYAPLYDPWAFIQAGLTDVATTGTITPITDKDNEMLSFFWESGTAAYLTNGIQTVRIENDVDGHILDKLVKSQGAGYEETKTSASFSPDDVVRIRYYIDLLRIRRPGQPDYGIEQPNA